MKYSIAAVSILLLTGNALAINANFAKVPMAPVDKIPDVSAEVMKRIMDVKKAGTTIMLDGLTTDMPRIPWQAQAGGPQMFFSDDPEYIRVPEGIAAAASMRAGEVRIYQYNCSQICKADDGSFTTNSKFGKPMPRKISVVVENLGKQPLNLKFNAHGYPKPSGNYHEVAKEAMVDFFAGKKNPNLPKDFTIGVGEMKPLDPKMENTLVSYDALSHVFAQVEISQPARFYVVQTDPDTPSAEAVKRLDKKVLPTPKGNAGRGWFSTTEFEVKNAPGFVLDTANGPQQLMMAEASEQDMWILGYDGKAISRLAGNYGVIYKCKIERKSSDKRGLAMFTWNLFQNSLWCNGIIGVMPSHTQGRLETGNIPVPSDKKILGLIPEASLIQVYPPVPEGKTDTVEFEFTPPGACCLPVPVFFVPVDWPAAK